MSDEETWPVVPSFDALAPELQEEALAALGEYGVFGGVDEPMVVDEARLPERIRTKIARLSAEGHQVTIGGVYAPTQADLAEWQRRLLNDGQQRPVNEYRHGGPEYPNGRARADRPGGRGDSRQVPLLRRRITVSVGAPAGLRPPRRPLAQLRFRLGREANRHVFSAVEEAAIIAAAVPVSWDSPEVQLASIAEMITREITDLTAWKSDYLAMQRLTFSPRAEAVEIRGHALRIALMRHKIGAAPEGTDDVHLVAQMAIAEQRKVLLALSTALRQRVAALWAYRKTLTELDSKLAALHALEAAVARNPELDDLVRQIGADVLATDRTTRHIAETRALTEQVEQLVDALRAVLMPQPRPPEVPPAPE